MPAAATVQNHMTEMLMAGEVVCNIGQVDPVTKRYLEKLVRKGEVVKWRGHWYPVAGAAFGIGPLKTCWGLASKFAPATATCA